MSERENEWRWYCFDCDIDLGPAVGKHNSKCPKCGSKSAVCRKVGRDYDKPHAERLRGEGEES